MSWNRPREPYEHPPSPEEPATEDHQDLASVRHSRRGFVHLFAATLFLRHQQRPAARHIGSAPTSSSCRRRRNEGEGALLAGEPNDSSRTGPCSIAYGRWGVEAPRRSCSSSGFNCYNVDVFLVAFDPVTDFTVRPWLKRHLKRDLAVDEIITGREIPVVPGDPSPFSARASRRGRWRRPAWSSSTAAFMSLESAIAWPASREGLQKWAREGRHLAVLVRVSDDFSPDRVAVGSARRPRRQGIVSDVVISTVRKQLSGLISAVVAISVTVWSIVLLIMAFAFCDRQRAPPRDRHPRAMGANRAQIAAIISAKRRCSPPWGRGRNRLGYGLLIAFKISCSIVWLPYLFPPAADLVALTAWALVLSLLTGLLSALLPSVSVIRREPYEAIRSAE
jgi:putative ABC transport system permease protein